MLVTAFSDIAADWVERLPDPFPPPWACAFGDDECGVWAEFRIQPGAVVQRMRWIEGGRFLMGSPAAEHERQEREGPQHWVTIQQGFWLAETACSQALWQAIMGYNPSRFTLKNGGGPQHPVEKISWRDVQAFLHKLDALLPGHALWQASLPTEAEWEYACRAGSTTPFHLGEDISPEQVNYQGEYPYRSGKKGVYRRKTVSVRELAKNAWGLYQMHGNVWEWCADTRREYTAQAVLDPGLAQALLPDLAVEEPCSVRGGGWCSGARRARSACRSRFQPDGQD
ncbi:MAG: hypothetical protein RL748_3222, partial [Pseudomonadota bacterium]